jgi:hypothetical protein
MPVQSKFDILHPVDDDICVLLETTCENSQFKIECHFLKELEHVGPDEKTALELVVAIGFVVDQGLVQV